MSFTNDDQRFDALDGLRGLAALVVMLSHYSQFFGMSWFKSAGSAVDLFFILSGFVIVHSYGNRIINGMKFHKFLMLRYLRLSPLNILAIAIGSCTFIAMDDIFFRDYKVTELILAKAVALGIAFIPFNNPYSWPYGNYGEVGGVFPLNLPAWSLFYEMLAYIACFIYISCRRKLPGLIFCSGCFIIFFTSTMYFGDTNAGWSENQLFQGVARVMGDFFMGALIYQLSTKANNLKNFIAAISFVLGFGLFILGNHIAVLCNVFVIIPLLIWSMSSVNVRGSFKYVCQFLGFISFPIYILHIPIITLALHQRNFINSYLEEYRLPLLIGITIIFAVIFGFLDIKIRKYFLKMIINPVRDRS